jgi:hypothetical protein
MISRIWHGWTEPANADAYEALLRAEVFAGILAKNVRHQVANAPRVSGNQAASKPLQCMEPNKKDAASRQQDAAEQEAAWSKGLHARYDPATGEPLSERLCSLLKRLDDAEWRKR